MCEWLGEARVVRSGPYTRHMVNVVTVDPCRCPLCGGTNHCAMAQPQIGRPQEPCWCTRAHFSAQLLQQVPEPARHKACICAACVQSSQNA